MTLLLDTLLDYNLVGLGGRMTLQKSEVDLARECKEEVDILRTAFPKADIELSMAGDGHGTFDASRIREALSNLVSNAAKHGIISEPISISVQGTDDAVTVIVENAIEERILASELRRLFDPLTSGTAKKHTGSRSSLGLGLFITREIAKAHGGTVSAACESDSISFTLSIPKTA